MEVPRRLPWQDLHHKRCMVFVDGENLAIRGKSLADKQEIELSSGPYYEAGSFVWLPGLPATDIIVMPPGQAGEEWT